MNRRRGLIINWAGCSRVIAGMAVFLGGLVLVFAASNFIIQAQDAKAVEGLDLVTVPTMSLATSTNSVGVTITPTVGGILASTSHDLIASTNVPTGYRISIATVGAPALVTTDGTVASPIPLANNTWGYALASSGATGIVNGFDYSYATPTPSSSSKWADPSVPAVIKKTANSTANDNTTIYYGAKADLSLANGVYANTVQYTAVANLMDIPTPTIISVTPNLGAAAGGTAVAIVGTGFTVNNQSVTTAVTIGGLDCAGISISSNTPVTGRDTICCNVPAHEAGMVEVAVATWGDTAVMTDGYMYLAAAIPMQTITDEMCTTDRKLVYDARDNSTYWMQRLADGKCWMLTNLAYGGDGDNTYGDVKQITETTVVSYTAPHYYVTPNANPTTNPAIPSTSTNGTGQYGYLYNWCAAMGGQTDTAACANGTTPAPNPNISICPSGWRLPTGGDEGEFTALRDAINPNFTSTDSGLRLAWLGMYGGMWNASSNYQGRYGLYWSSTLNSSTNAFSLDYHSAYVTSSNVNSKWLGLAVRCVLNEPAKTGEIIQNVTMETCPTTRTRVIDARDNRTYWIQKLADGKCWMLTNLAYGGGGVNTYGDVKNIVHNHASDYTQPYYMIPSGANVTSDTTDPSTSTDGTGQYGYLYNWRAAMGAQVGTAACLSAFTPNPDANISICPAGWRLPTGGSGSEFDALNKAVNAGSTSNDAGLRSDWLGAYGGMRYSGFIYQGDSGWYWSSTQNIRFNFAWNTVRITSIEIKRTGLAVRCVAI